MKKRGRGFSFAEVLATLALLGVMAGLSLPVFRSQRNARTTSQAGAEYTASLLRLVRQQAISSAQPWALALPTNGGVEPVASGAYVLFGQDPKLWRSLSFPSESLQCMAHLGSYAGPTWSSTRPNTVSQPPVLPAGWNPLGPSDPYLCFWPDGSCSSNMEHDQGQYRLVVGQSLQADSGGLQRAHLPYTVSISLLGNVDVQEGIPGANPALLSSQAVASLAPPSLPILPLGANQNPQLVAPYLKVSPEPEPATLGNLTTPGSTATVPLDGMLTLEALARDPDGDPLRCNWTCSGPKAGHSFSHSGDLAMTWDSQAACWVSRWHWKPPADAVPGEVYQLNCQVSDGRGGTVSPADVGAQIPQICTIRPRKIVYTKVTGTAEEVCVCNWDGTNPTTIWSEAQAAESGFYPVAPYPVFSPDGKTIALILDYAPAERGLFVCNPDGSNLRQIGVMPYRANGLCWDPAGRYIYSVQDPDFTGTQTIERYDYSSAMGIPEVVAQWPQTAAVAENIDIHPSGKFFVKMAATHIKFIWPRTPTLPEAIIEIPGFFEFPSFSPDGTSVLAHNGVHEFLQQITWDEAARTVSLVGTPTVVTAGGHDFHKISLSKDGQWMLGVSSAVGQIGIFKLGQTSGLIFDLPGTDDPRFSP